VSQYPPPTPTPPNYYQPSYYGQPPVDFSQYLPPGEAELLAPARRASILQGVLGGLMLLCCVGVGTAPWWSSPAEIIAQSGVQMSELPPGWTLEGMVKAVYGVAGACGSFLGLGLIALSLFVHRGGAAPAVASLILEGLVVLVLLLNVISGVVQALGNPMIGALVLLVVAVPLVLFIMNMTWLAAAARNAGRIALARQQYHSQFYTHPQQQQAYGQSAYGQAGYGVPAGAPGGYAPPGYGYGYAPPPPPSFAPPPPPHQSPQQHHQPPQPEPAPSPPQPGQSERGEADGPPTPPAAG
jgi:hypothetical protein